MPRSMVGLLAAVGATMSALVAFAHGFLITITIVDAAAAAGLATYLALPAKKSLSCSINETVRDSWVEVLTSAALFQKRVSARTGAHW